MALECLSSWKSSCEGANKAVWQIPCQKCSWLWIAAIVGGAAWLWIWKSLLEFVQPKTNFLWQSRNVGAVFPLLSAWPAQSGWPLWASRTLQFLTKNLQKSCHEFFSACVTKKYQWQLSKSAWNFHWFLLVLERNSLCLKVADPGLKMSCLSRSFQVYVRPQLPLW